MPTNTTTTSSQLPDYAAPFYQGYLDRAFNVANQAYQPYTGQTVAALNPYQTQAWNAMANRAQQGSPVMNAANAGLTRMMNPNQSNPYLTQQINAAQQDVVRNWNDVQLPKFMTQDANSGSFGNAGLAQVQAGAMRDMRRDMGNIASNMRYQNYNDSQGRALSAMGMAPQFAQQDYNDLDRLAQAGSNFQNYNQSRLNDAYSRFQESRQYPQQQLDIMRNALGLNYGQNQTTQQQTQGPSNASSLLGGALTGAGLYNLLFGRSGNPTPNNSNPYMGGES